MNSSTTLKFESLRSDYPCRCLERKSPDEKIYRGRGFSRWALFSSVTVLLALSACEMREQPKYKPLSSSTLFADGASARVPVKGSVSRDNPEEIAVASGREGFLIYCSPCHNTNNDGRGKVVSRGFPAAPDLSQKPSRADETLRIIMEGKNASPSYRGIMPESQAREISKFMESNFPGEGAR